jgi:hypothetical protein
MIYRDEINQIKSMCVNRMWSSHNFQLGMGHGKNNGYMQEWSAWIGYILKNKNWKCIKTYILTATCLACTSKKYNQHLAWIMPVWVREIRDQVMPMRTAFHCLTTISDPNHILLVTPHSLHYILLLTAYPMYQILFVIAHTLHKMLIVTPHPL